MKLRNEKLLSFFFWVSGLTTLTVVFILMGFLITKAHGVLSLKLFFGNADPIEALLLRERVFDGLFPAIVGTLLVVSGSVIWAIPLGILAGIYLAEFSPPRLKKVFDFSYDVLASSPSIVVGLFGLTIAIFLHRHLSDRIYPCLLISSIALAILILPYIVRTTQLSLEAVPQSVRAAGLSLGATKTENLIHVLLPGSLTGILSGIILALGRAAEDTAVIMLTGVVATAGIPKSIFSEYEALPFFIYYISSQYSDRHELMTGFGAALVLVSISAGLFLLAHFLKNLLTKQWT